MSKETVIETDVLVLGGGVAGAHVLAGTDPIVRGRKDPQRLAGAAAVQKGVFLHHRKLVAQPLLDQALDIRHLSPEFP